MSLKHILSAIRVMSSQSKVQQAEKLSRKICYSIYNEYKYQPVRKVSPKQ
jgi:hypothetical protein